jgi:hypothetical protein
MLRFLLALLLATSSQAATRYLTDRAGAPVQWVEWGPAAIARAQKEKRPLFVSIGFAASWDVQRMHREAFLDGENAKALNAYFVPVLLDRIEHPELAETLEAITGSRVVPLNLLLTPALQPFAHAGVLSTPELNRMLVLNANRWSSERAAVEAEAHALVQRARLTAETRAPLPVDATTLEAVVDGVGKRYAEQKTLDPMTLSFLLRYAARTRYENIRTLAIDTLRRTAVSRLYDHLGGGFFRCEGCYDKHLHDQALYAIALLDTREPDLLRVARATVDYVLRDLRLDNRGAFEASQYAHSLVPGEGPVFVDGAFYSWTDEQLARVIGNELVPRVRAYLGAPKLEHDLAAPLATLFESRQKRPAPFREPLFVASWNGLMISAASRAAIVFDERRYADAAIGAATIAIARKSLPLAEDHAFLVQGLLDLFEATSDPKWLAAAIALQQKQDSLFWDASAGRYTTGTTLPESLRGLLRERDEHTPAINSIAASNLLRLAALTGNETWRARPAMIFHSFGGRLRNDGPSLTQLAHAYELSLVTPAIVVITGDVRKQETHDLLRTFHDRPEPMRTVVLLPHKGPAREKLVKALPFIAALAPEDKQPVAYRCASGECRRL